MNTADVVALSTVPLSTLVVWVGRKSVKAFLAQRAPDPTPGYEPVKAVIQSLQPEADGSVLVGIQFVLGDVSDTYNFVVPANVDQEQYITDAVQEEAAVFRPRLENYQAAATAYAEWLLTHDPNEPEAPEPPAADSPPALSSGLQALVGYQIEL